MSGVKQLLVDPGRIDGRDKFTVHMNLCDLAPASLWNLALPNFGRFQVYVLV